jgi:hypothetical protein
MRVAGWPDYGLHIYIARRILGTADWEVQCRKLISSYDLTVPWHEDLDTHSLRV